ncbi:hypothetical protein F2981_25820 (plasmid) [Sinorhizobium meliloti]|nr:hypothetical protein [Sinorhizobium meliloti]
MPSRMPTMERRRGPPAGWETDPGSEEHRQVLHALVRAFCEAGALACQSRTELRRRSRRDDRDRRREAPANRPSRACFWPNEASAARRCFTTRRAEDWSQATAGLRRKVQMVFQDPYSSMNPRMTVFDIVSEPWRIHKDILETARWRDRVTELLGSSA